LQRKIWRAIEELQLFTSKSKDIYFSERGKLKLVTDTCFLDAVSELTVIIDKLKKIKKSLDASKI
jgi:hypothetical protein